MRWSEIIESSGKKNVLNLIKKASDYFGQDSLYGGNCGTFALALAEYINQPCYILIFCQNDFEDMEDVAITDLIASEPRIYHCAVSIDGKIYDGDGSIDTNHIADWIFDEYDDDDPLLLRYPSSEVKLDTLIGNDTDWNISVGVFLRFFKGKQTDNENTELTESSNIFYHSSANELDVGTILTGRGSDYDRDWGYVPFFEVLERYRPANKLSHRDAVFMVGNEDDLDSAGGSTEYVFTLKALGSVSKHDMNWSSRIASMVDDGLDYDDTRIKQAAEKYWSGEPTDDPLWEYLTTKAEILAVEEF
jgi:hypothetical protein